jgi:hypothetical protein
VDSGEIVSGGPLQEALAGRRRPGVRTALDRLARWFPRSAAREAVTTTLRLDVPREQAWATLRFYEDIPTRPSPLLRLLLPTPVRSEGQKLRPGGVVRCTYEGGHLIKRITAAERPGLLRFDVLEQDLGIEHCISLAEGSYRIRDLGTGCEVLLTTEYRGHLRPRFLWRPVERALAHAVHLHILRGMRDLQGH